MDKNLASKNVKELKELAKERGVKGYYKMVRSQLLNALGEGVEVIPLVDIPLPPIQQPIQLSLSSKNVKELKELAKERGVKGYYKMNRSDLLSALEGGIQKLHVIEPKITQPIIQTQQNLSTKNVKELKELAKERGVKGYYKMNRSQLLIALERGIDTVHPEIIPQIIQPTIQPVVQQMVDLTSIIRDVLKDVIIKGETLESHSPDSFTFKELDKYISLLEGERKQEFKRKLHQLIDDVVLHSMQYVCLSAYVREERRLFGEKFEAARDILQQIFKIRIEELSQKFPEYIKLDVFSEQDFRPILSVLGDRSKLMTLSDVKKCITKDTEVVYENILKELGIQQRKQLSPQKEKEIPNRQKYIDDVLTNIQISKHDEYMRHINTKILKCLGMY